MSKSGFRGNLTPEQDDVPTPSLELVEHLEKSFPRELDSVPLVGSVDQAVALATAMAHNKGTQEVISYIRNLRNKE